MQRMFILYALAVGLLATGIGTVGFELYALVTRSGFNPFWFVVGGGGGLVLGRLTLWRARRRRRQIESRNRERILLDLARRRGGLLEAGEAARAVDLSQPEAQKLLETLVKQGRADIDVTDSGQTVFKFDERRQLGA